MIPSGKKDILEPLALNILKEYSAKYLHYKRVQKESFPDLYDAKNNNAVEITSDLSDKYWHRLIKRDTSIHFGNDDRQDTKGAIFRKMYKKYEGINEIELFVFSWYIDHANFAQTLFNDIFEQYPKAKTKFLRIFIFSSCLKKLWILDFAKKSISTFCPRNENNK